MKTKKYWHPSLPHYPMFCYMIIIWNLHIFFRKSIILKQNRCLIILCNELCIHTNSIRNSVYVKKKYLIPLRTRSFTSRQNFEIVDLFYTRYALTNLPMYKYMYVYTHRQLEKTLGGLGYVHILQRKRETHEIINVEGKYVGNMRREGMR